MRILSCGNSICPVAFTDVISAEKRAARIETGNPKDCCEAPYGNPVNASIGAKLQAESDYAGVGPNPLSFTRSYKSNRRLFDEVAMTNWVSTYDRRIVLLPNSSGYGGYAERPTGQTFLFEFKEGVPTFDSDIADKITQQKDNQGNTIRWLFTNASDESVEQYDSAGKLLSITDRRGQIQTLFYSDANTSVDIAPRPDLLISVQNHYGRQINFTYNNLGQLKTLTDPAGQLYEYSYDPKGNVTSVKYPDGNIRQYHFNEPQYVNNTNFPYALTGITDENGVRFATFSYASSGKTISSRHNGNVDIYTFNYFTSSRGPTATTVITPLGTQRSLNLAIVHGVARISNETQPASNGSGSASRTMTYDANGNIATRTDWNGNQTTYSYDLNRNLETRRVEAAGTAQARTISTQWHPAYRLQSAIAEPQRLTTFSYDANGNLLTKTEQATSDATGAQAFNAAGVGTPRTWRSTYNSVGQVLTATDPLGNVSSYSYDGQGNLVAVTNAAGHVTTLSHYDANGRVGRIVDANGLITDLSYHPRGWLSAKTVGGETTGYDYDGVGQLTKATLPDGSSLTYTYDEAHRLTGIADSLGNRIAYTLDLTGNRIKEEVKDPNGTLVRQTTRVYDALNRLQQITGGQP